MNMFGLSKAETRTDASQTIADRTDIIKITNQHYVNGNPIKGPFEEHLETAVFGLGCFWGAERKFWEISGVYTTAVGYAGGSTRNATYQDACSGLSGHTEGVLVVFDPKLVSYAELLKVFWESHDPTQGMRQGNDRGSQYRSAIYAYSDEQLSLALSTRAEYQQRLSTSGYTAITTEIREAPEFFYAEDHHQQYLAKNPQGYCSIGGTGVSCA